MKKFRNTDYLVLEDGTIVGKRVSAIRPKITKQGYAEVSLCSKDGTLYLRVHRIVAETYIPNPENKPFVNHIDGNKLNNCVQNLEWVTHQENMEHAKNHKLIHMGNRNARSKLTEDEVEEICMMLQYGMRNYDIAKHFEAATAATVGGIRFGAAWKHISCKYVIPERSRSLSEETVHWICQQLENAVSNYEILKTTTNKRVSKGIIKDIKRRRIYSDICSQYNY